MNNRIAIALAAFVFHAAALAQATPVGLWKTIDDESKTEKSLVRIVESGGVLTGKVEKMLTDKADAKCVECTDERKGQPVQGMAILRGIKPYAAEKGTWVGGTILDPNNGKTYKVRLTPKDDGKKLEVRGFIGPFYRNQTWIRVQ